MAWVLNPIFDFRSIFTFLEKGTCSSTFLKYCIKNKYIFGSYIKKEIRRCRFLFLCDVIFRGEFDLKID